MGDFLKVKSRWFYPILISAVLIIVAIVALIAFLTT